MLQKILLQIINFVLRSDISKVNTVPLQQTASALAKHDVRSNFVSLGEPMRTSELSWYVM
jgi:hypothetical protein